MKRIASAFQGAIRGYAKHGGLSLSASISFFTILSLVPLLFIVISVIGFVLGHSDELFQKVISAIENFIPNLSPQLVSDLNGVVKHSQALGWVGLAVLLWSSDLAVSAVSQALDIIFESKKKRRFMVSKLISLSVIVGGGLALIVSFSLPSMLKVMAKNNLFLGIVIPLLLPFVTFVAVLMILPVSRARIRDVMYGAFLFSVLWEAAKAFFNWYIRNVAKINLVYGSLGSLFITILWIFYAANVFLICAEFVSSLRRSTVDPFGGAQGQS